MAVNDNALIQPVRGTLFVAPAETPLPDDLTQLTLSVDTVGDWKNFGHTSNDNKLTWNKDGGDATSHDTWLVAGARTTYASTTLSFTGNSVQVDTDTLKQVYNGWVTDKGLVVSSVETVEQKLAFIILSYDSGNDEYFGTYLPNVSFAYSNLPDFSGDNFVELSFTGTANSSTTLPVNPVNGRRGTYAFIPPELFAGKQATVAVTGIGIAPATLALNVDATADLTVAFTPANATNQKYTVAVSDPAKASATIEGLTVHVTGKAATDAGKPAVVTVTSEDGKKTAATNVTVNPKA